MKRGQVTVFIILGIVVVAIIGLVVYLRGGFLNESLTGEEASRLVSLQVDPVKQHVIDCTKKELVKGVHLVSIQGGYYDPVYYEELGGVDVSYACLSGVNRMPLLNFIEKEINQYMSSSEARNNIQECVDDFKFFKNRGLNIEHNFDNFELDVPRVTETKIRQNIFYPITLSRDEANSRVDDLGFDIDSNLKGVHRLASMISNSECSGEHFSMEDYAWERREEGEEIPATLSSGDSNPYYSHSSNGVPKYLTSVNVEEDGEPLKFHFIISR